MFITKRAKVAQQDKRRINELSAQRPAASSPARLPGEASVELVQCPRCRRSAARVIGQSDVMPVLYLRCDGCHATSVAGL